MTLESKIMEFTKVERTQKEIIENFPEYSPNEITICLRDLEMFQAITIDIKYRANPTNENSIPGFNGAA
jgi:hypothetical protein